jgi:hypothetical protein
MLDTTQTLSSTIVHQADDDDLPGEVVASDGPLKGLRQSTLSGYADDDRTAVDRPLRPPSLGPTATERDATAPGRL